MMRVLRVVLGPVLILAGAAMLLAQVVNFYVAGKLSARLTGGGIGLLGIGIFLTRDSWEDRHRKSPIEKQEEEITSEEFDARFRDVDGE